MKKLLLVFAFVTGISALASAQTGKAVRPQSKATPAAQPATPAGFTNAAGKVPSTTPAPAVQPKQKAVAKKTKAVAAKKD